MGKEDTSAKKRRKLNSNSSEISKQPPVDVYKVRSMFVLLLLHLMI